MAKQENKLDNASGMILGGCVIIGIGVGLLVDKTAVFTVIGIGVGLVIMAVLRLSRK